MAKQAVTANPCPTCGAQMGMSGAPETKRVIGAAQPKSEKPLHVERRRRAAAIRAANLSGGA